MASDRRGSIPSFDEPDAEWTDDYAWTRYRGPRPYPVPGGWVTNTADEGGMMWYYFPDIGERYESEHEVAEAVAYDELEAARDGDAWFVPEVEYWDESEGVENTAWHLQINAETVFRYVDPEFDDAWAACAEALARFDVGEPVGEIDTVPASGTPADEWLTPEERAATRQRERDQRRRAENQSLGDFAGGER